MTKPKPLMLRFATSPSVSTRTGSSSWLYEHRRMHSVCVSATDKNEAPLSLRVVQVLRRSFTHHGEITMSTATKTNDLMTWDETCDRLQCSHDEEDNALSSVIQEGYLTPIYLGDLIRFYRRQVESLAEKFGLGTDEEEAE